MLKIDRQKKILSRLETTSLAERSIPERYGLQVYICNSPEAFFQEIGQDLFLIDKEVQPSDDVEDRIDLLTVDKEGQAVIIELKRGNNKLQMYQAISYAGMVAKWQPDDFFTTLDADKRERLLDFLEVEKEEINRHQRIILLAEAFDYSVLVGAEWLTEQFGVSILCCRLSVAREAAGDAEYIVCSNIFPAPELAQQAIRRGRTRVGVREAKWSNWDDALQNVTDDALVEFFKKELAAGRENNLRGRVLRWRIAGKRRWAMMVRTRIAYVWQHGRFEGDIAFWRNSLSDPDAVKSVKQERCLSFAVITEADFAFFRVAATENLTTAKWVASKSDEDETLADVDGQEAT